MNKWSAQSKWRGLLIDFKTLTNFICFGVNCLEKSEIRKQGFLEMGQVTKSCYMDGIAVWNLKIKGTLSSTQMPSHFIDMSPLHCEKMS